MGAPPADVFRSDVRNIFQEVLAEQLGEVRRSLREDLCEELQKFLAASRRRFSSPSVPPQAPKSMNHVKTHGSEPAICAPSRSTQSMLNSDDDDRDQHEWMFRHIRRFNAVVLDCGDDDDDDDGTRRSQPQKKLRVGGAMRHSDVCSSSSSSIAKDGVLPMHDGASKVMRFDDLHRSPSATTSPGISNTNLRGESPVGAWVDGCERGSGSIGESIGTPDSAPKGFLRQSSMSRLLRSTRHFDLAAGRIGRVAKRVVRSHCFDYFMCTVIAVNALTIGVQTNYAAENRTSDFPRLFDISEYVFCLIFTVELLMRLSVFRFNFFRMQGWEWNVFDFVVVQLQIMELFLGVLPSFAFVRMLRVMRLIRGIRFIRILRYVAELRALVASIGASLASLIWTLVLLVLMLYMLALCLTQLVVDHRLLNIAEDDRDSFTDLVTYYGTLSRSMLSLFQAVSGGLDWDDCVAPLMDHISIWLAPAFSLYVAFTLLALMNVVTAIFVDSVLETTKKDKNVFMANNVRELFTSVDGGVREGSMDWETFQSKLDTQPMIEFFKAIDLDRSEATCLFRLLDLDNGGSVDAEEFLSGCLRLRGPAKALDLALLISEVGKLSQHLKSRDCGTGSSNVSILK